MSPYKFVSCVVVSLAIATTGVAVWADGLSNGDAKIIPVQMTSEPNSFLGLKLGVPILSSISNQCTWTSEDFCVNIDPPDRDDPGLGSATVKNGPDLGFFYTVFIDTVDSKISKLTLINLDAYELLRNAVIAKYGQPTKIKKGSFIADANGASYEADQLIWVGRNVSMVLYQNSGELGKNNFVIKYLPLENVREAREAAAGAKTSNEAASKM